MEINTGSHSTGYYSTGNYSTGSHSTGYYSTGNRSTGNRSTGDWSTGDYSTGSYSTGDWSTGDYSTGSYSTGNYSTGSHSTGNWSISNYSTGHFSTEDYSGYGAFDKPCSLEKWAEAKKPNFLFFNLIEWVREKDMTYKEKENNPQYKTTNGYLKVYNYKEAWRRSWDKNIADRKNQIKLLEALPNFNYDKFVEISGIDYRKADKEDEDMVEIKVEGKIKRISRISAKELNLI